MVKEKNIIIIAGPNGAGKTTFAKEFLPNEAGCPIFVNAGLKRDGLIFTTFINSWQTPGFFTTTQAGRQNCLKKERCDEGKRSRIHGKDLAGVEAALLRAAKRAWEIAKQTHTPLVYYENGNFDDLFFSLNGGSRNVRREKGKGHI